MGFNSSPILLNTLDTDQALIGKPWRINGCAFKEKSGAGVVWDGHVAATGMGSS
jgi:hypothetical protein